MKLTMTSIIATREMKQTHSNGTKTKIEIQLGIPMRRTEDVGSPWYCPFQILGVGNDKVRSASGEDSMQALYLALVMIGVVISTSNLGELDWADMHNFGFPEART